MSFSEDVKKRYEAIGWQVIRVTDGMMLVQFKKQSVKGKELYKPTLIIIDTVIGFGSSNEGTNKVHGNPLGKKMVKMLKFLMALIMTNFMFLKKFMMILLIHVLKRGKKSL